MASGLLGEMLFKDRGFRSWPAVWDKYLWWEYSWIGLLVIWPCQCWLPLSLRSLTKKYITDRSYKYLWMRYTLAMLFTTEIYRVRPLTISWRIYVSCKSSWCLTWSEVWQQRLSPGMNQSSLQHPNVFLTRSNLYIGQTQYLFVVQLQNSN